MTVAPPKQRLRGVVGESAPRVDAPPKVKGEFLYGSDLSREGMLYGATLRSPHAHARIVAIDVAAARRMPGVRAVLTSDDLPDAREVRPHAFGPADARDERRALCRRGGSDRRSG